MSGPEGTVHAFEINENVIDLLEANRKVANVHHARVVKRAVTKTTGYRDFFVPRAGDEAEGSLAKSGRYIRTHDPRAGQVGPPNR